MSAIQLLLVVFAVFALSRVVRRFRHGGLSRVELFLWSGAWIAVGVVAVLPDTTSVAARMLGVTRGADLAIYVALILVFFLMFRMFTKIEDLERQITRVVRARALDDLERNAAAGAPPKDE